MKIYNDGYIDECVYFYPSTMAYELFCDKKDCKNCKVYPYMTEVEPSIGYTEVKNGMFLYLMGEG